jgi:GNAT superfamily N-acetyltransferase
MRDLALLLHGASMVRAIAFYRDDPAAGPAPTAGPVMHSNGTESVKRRRVLGTLASLTRAISTRVFAHQWQYITLKVLQEEPGSVSGPGADGPTECLVIDCLAAFDAVAREIGKSFRDSVVDLRARVVSGCVLSMARRRRHDGRFEVIGYEIAERGIFSALGRRMPVADDVIFSHYVEVLPAFRGQRIHRLLFSTRDAYFRQRGGRVVCGVCEPHNRASLQALHRDGAIIVGVVERITVLRVFVMAYTPFDRIAHLLY